MNLPVRIGAVRTRHLAIVLFAVYLALLPADARACACCSDRGSRIVATEKLDGPRMAAIDQVEFSKTAHLYSGPADRSDSLVDGFGSEYTLDVARRKGKLVFSFRSLQNQPGTLTLAIPKTIAIFEVDPHGDAKDEGLGPSLYKEWRLTARAAGTGIFRRGAARRQTLTLILHGSGRGCTDATHFTNWSLQLAGPAGSAILFGPLESGAK